MWIRVPTVSRAMVSNLLGILGLAGIVVATGGLTGNPWWATLVGSLFLVGISYASYTHAAAAADAEQGTRPATSAVPPPPAGGGGASPVRRAAA